MKRARLHKRCKMYGLSVLFMLTLLLGSGVSVNAASSITNQTVKTSITASGTRALKIQWNRISGDHFPGKVALHIVGMVLGLAICYIFGTVWLAGQLNMTFVAGLGVGVIPYLPGDAVKIIFTALIGPKLRREIYRLGE